MSQAFYLIEQYRLKREIADIKRQQAFAPHLGLTGEELDKLDEELTLRHQAILADLTAPKPRCTAKQVKQHKYKGFPAEISYRTRGLIIHQQRIVQKRKNLRSNYKKLHTEFNANERLIPLLTPKAFDLREKLIDQNQQRASQAKQMRDQMSELSVASFAVNSHLMASLRRDYFENCMDEHLNQLAKIIPNARQFIRLNLMDSFNAKRRS